jgi:ribosomal protein S18 acetylase RimI-like enzyme
MLAASWGTTTDGAAAGATAMLRIFQAETVDHKRHVRQLFREHGEWANARCIQEYDISFDIGEVLERTMAELGQFLAPHGCLLLAEYDSQIVGCACLRTIGEGIGEIKRMYVRPDHRGRGIGRALFEEILSAARQNGHATIRLDTAGFMKEAQALYRSAGFHDIEPYAESEIPEEFRRHWVFMELGLD